jgi:hypothetical protein
MNSSVPSSQQYIVFHSSSGYIYFKENLDNWRNAPLPPQKSSLIFVMLLKLLRYNSSRLLQLGESVKWIEKQDSADNEEWPWASRESLYCYIPLVPGASDHLVELVLPWHPCSKYDEHTWTIEVSIWRDFLYCAIQFHLLLLESLHFLDRVFQAQKDSLKPKKIAARITTVWENMEER